MKFSVAHYKKADSDWLVNGGKLIVTDSEYVLKCFLKTVARFEADKTKLCKIPDNMLLIIKTAKEKSLIRLSNRLCYNLGNNIGRMVQCTYITNIYSIIMLNFLQ